MMTPVDNGWTERCGYKPAGIGHSFGMKRCQWHGSRNHHARPVGMRWNPAVEMTVCTDGTSPYSYLGWDGRRQNIAHPGTAAALVPSAWERDLLSSLTAKKAEEKKVANPWRVWKGKWKTKSSADESWIEDGNFDSRNWLEMAPGDGVGPLNWPKWMGSELELAGSYQARGD